MSDDKTLPDLLLDGRLKLHQRAQGHRAGTDALLLAAAAPALVSGLVVDIGAGAGAVGLAVALANPGVDVVLLEKNPAVAAEARKNVATNGLRARVVEADLFDVFARKAEDLVEKADLVLTNPPFLNAGAARVSPDADRALAHVLDEGGLEKWLRACLAVLRPGGRFAMIHRADALAEILAALGGRLGGLEILPIFPKAEQGAIRVILRGKKGSKAPLALLPGLVLHGEHGKFSPPTEEVHRRGRRLFAD